MQAIINDNNHPTPNCTFRSFIPVAIANIERPLSARATANAPPSEPVSIDIMGDAEVKTSQWRLVEVGRVVLFTTGPYVNKLATIVEIIDHKRVRTL